MRAQAITFVGHCTGCGGRSETPRGAVEFTHELQRDDGDWLCLVCARLLAEKLLAAANDCADKLRRGFRHVNDAWVPGARAAKPAPKRRGKAVRRG